jgi:hypothetical protein
MKAGTTTQRALAFDYGGLPRGATSNDISAR